MKYAHIDENNKLLGFYDNGIHSEIPKPKIQLTENQWQNALDNNHNKINSDGTSETFDFRTDEEKASDQAYLDELAQKETDKASGKAKLKELGLTDAQINALVGE
jgi:hypothetical protein